MDDERVDVFVIVVWLCSSSWRVAFGVGGLGVTIWTGLRAHAVT